MNEPISITDHVNTINKIFPRVKVSDFMIVKNEHAKILLQSLHDSYDKLIVNITNNNISNSLHFDDVDGAIIEEGSSLKNNKKIYLEKQAKALVMTGGKSLERGSSGGSYKNSLFIVLECIIC